MTTREIAKLLGVPKQTVDAYTEREWLSFIQVPYDHPVIKFRRDFSEDDLQHFYNRCEKRIGTKGRVYWVEKNHPYVRQTGPKHVKEAEEMPEWAKRLETKLDKLLKLWGNEAA